MSALSKGRQEILAEAVRSNDEDESAGEQPEDSSEFGEQNEGKSLDAFLPTLFHLKGNYF